MKHVIAHFGLTLTRHVWVRSDLSIYKMVVEIHTWSPGWKCIIIIIIINIIVVVVVGRGWEGIGGSKHAPGRMNVIALGPKLAKKNVNAYRKMKPHRWM